MKSNPFIPGRISSQPQPLEEFLPNLPSSLFSTWLKQTSPQPNFHLDPFGSAPHPLLDAARGGYRILVAVNNPIVRYLFTYLSQSPSPSDLKSALATLASSFKGEERLEPHVLSLYETECPHCGRKISAQGFIWKAKGAAPERKLCHCQYCHNQGDYPTNSFDVEKAQAHQENSLYHARALTRIAPPGDPIRAQAKNALQIYTPRAVYALFTLINKLSGLSPSDPERDHISALLLHAFYRANSLWSPARKFRNIKRLARPATYLEKNVWHCLEEAIDIWPDDHPPTKVSFWPDPPPQGGGLSLYAGRFKELSDQLDGKVGSAVMVVPQPNPTFWSLSALWAGWLWGQEQAAPLRKSLSLQDPDWSWHTQALVNTLSSLTPYLSPPAQSFAILPDVSSEFLTSTLAASHTAGFQVKSIALEPHRRETQIVWGRKDFTPPSPPPEDPKAVLRDAGYTHLSDRGEPSYSLLLHAAGMTALDQEEAFPRGEEKGLPNLYQSLNTALEETYAYRQGFLHFPDSDTWWHQELSLDVSPLSDQVERGLVNHLLGESEPIHQQELEKGVFTSFPGLMTPSSELIQVCLSSYGEQSPPSSDDWILKANESPSARRQDMDEMVELLGELGPRLSFNVKQNPPRGNIRVCTWLMDEEPMYTFFISASGILGKLILVDPKPPPNPWIVLPGSRAHLVVYKLNHNQPLAKRVEGDWGFLKYRHLRRLADDESLTKDNMEERFRLDPLKYDAPQLPLI